MFILDNSSLLLAVPRNVFTAVGLPLVVGTVLAILIFAFMARFYAAHSCVPRRGRVVDVGLMLRFTGVLIIIYLDAILTLCEITLDDKQLGGIWRFDLYWTSTHFV